MGRDRSGGSPKLGPSMYHQPTVRRNQRKLYLIKRKSVVTEKKKN